MDQIPLGRPSVISRLAASMRAAFSPERALPQDSATHLTYFLISLAMISLPFLLNGKADSEEISLGRYKLPPMCISKMCGAECPGCGMTRAFVHLTHGRLEHSFSSNRVGLLLYAFFVIQVPFRFYLYRRPAARQANWARRLQVYTGSLVLAALVINWLLRLISV